MVSSKKREEGTVKILLNNLSFVCRLFWGWSLAICLQVSPF